ncbi:MAG: hypothetical protein PHS96_13230 [Anaerolineales bacterium]|nr:hypothetical protein [Anaerolineales bacterium]
MDIFFQDPSAIPLPPEEVRIRALRAEPRPDGKRVRVTLELTPFLKRPSGEISVSDPAGEEAASASIVESMNPKMEFTLHLRGEPAAGRYTLRAVVFYLAEGSEGAADAPPDPTNRTVVDQAQADFVIP